MRFEQLNDYNGNHTAYLFSNESINTWRSLLEDVSVDKAAGICSGGEVSFFSFLPRVKKQLDLIDHAPHALWYAIGKYHCIEKLGAKKALELFTKGTPEELVPLFQEANGGLPTNTREHTRVSGFESDSRYRSDYAYELRTAYRHIMEDWIADFRKNRTKVTFLHGDLDDLIDRGPYDLVYLSNALQYTGRNGGRMGDGFHVQQYVKPGGLVCYTTGAGALALPKPVQHFKILADKVYDPYTAAGRSYDYYGMRWRYIVCQTPEAA